MENLPTVLLGLSPIIKMLIYCFICDFLKELPVLSPSMSSLAIQHKMTWSNSRNNGPLPLTTCGLPHSLLKIWLVCPPHLVVLESKNEHTNCTRTEAFQELSWFQNTGGSSSLPLPLVSKHLFQKDS